MNEPVRRRSLLERYLLLWLILSSGLAMVWPHVWESIHSSFPEALASVLRADFDPFVESRVYQGQPQPWLTLTVVITMFAVGCLLPADEIRQVMQRWPTVIGGTAVQYTSMPLLAWGLATLFRLPDDLRIGVIMVGCVPGAMASNVLTLAAKGNISYSVSLTTSATLLSPVIVPVVMWLTLGKSVETAVFVEASARLLREVVLPVVAGHLLCRMSDRFSGISRRVAGPVANLAILWIIAVVVGLNRDRIMALSGTLFAVLLLLNLLGYLAGWLGGSGLGLTTGMRRALMLEVGMQNAGVGAKLASDLFEGSTTTMIPAAIYAFGCMLTGTILAHFMAGREEARGSSGES
ncbi:Sodium Bile acid symporter family protein [Maioricimonas rarisocia]|uniref:Sodium Bile acid symporter family protein n=1 Tax=Maioricimonas rarisocia TaxID=2528026 RepID=A0A517Z569_9PLAN|nr:bile acid:sodium symporter family protein [Maioricimonas rarisocia]QDU37597.1 Sodium Bile acid symporter family protein [Maioricimonas rarisocia]